MSIFRNNRKKVDKWLKKIDAVITWLVLWWIVASVYWIKKEHDKLEKEQEEKLKNEELQKGMMDLRSILKALVFWFKEEKPKKTFFQKLFWIFKLWKDE